MSGYGYLNKIIIAMAFIRVKVLESTTAALSTHFTNFYFD